MGKLYRVGIPVASNVLERRRDSWITVSWAVWCPWEKRWGSDTRGVEKDSDARFAVVPRLGKNQLADKWKSPSRDEGCHQGLSMLDL